MKIQIDLDPRDVWKIQEQAARTGQTPGQVLRAELATRRTARDLPDAIQGRVKAGWCDADIAAELNQTNASVARVRRTLGLTANPNPNRSGGGRRPEAA